MAVINTNVKALFSQMALKTSGLEQSKAMQQLSTGKRINSARDDAAGMSIATRMTHQIRSLNQAVRNAGDAISLIQTAEGATNEITDMMQRMRELAVQAVNDTNANADRSYLDLEFQQLKQQIVQIADNTEWNGFPVLSGKAGQQVGEMPVYKTTSQNQFSDIFISPTTSRTVTGTNGSTAVDSTETYDTTTTTSPYLISGSVKIDVDASGSIKATFKTPDANATPITLNATKVMTTGSTPAWTGEIKFDKTDPMNSTVFAKDVKYKFNTALGATIASPVNSSLQVDVNGGIPTLHNGDLTINGIVIGPSSAADDHVSPINNAAGSAIAKAAAINAKAVDQGVSQGEIQAVTFSGTPNFGNSATANISVAGVQIDLTSAMDTPVLIAKSVAAQLQADPTFNNTGCTVSWSTGSPTVTINYPTSSGNVDKVAVTGADELGFHSVTNTTQQYAAVQPGTGVFAKVNENVFGGQAMSGLSVVTGRVYVNGYASADIQSVMNNPQATRSNVVRAINLISDKTGVKALDSGSDEKGVTLVAADGRNIEVQFETTGTTTETDFGKRLGLREGVQSATISLESKITSPTVLGSNTGNITNVGFDAGNYSKNEATLNTHVRDLGDAAVAQVTSFKFTAGVLAADDTVSVVVNGKTFKHIAATGETLKDAMDDIYGKLTASATAPKNVMVSRGSSGEILITATEPGVPFTASSTNTGTSFAATTTEVVANAKAKVVGLSMNDLMINGVAIRATDANDDTNSDVTVSSSDRASSAIAMAAAINDSTSITGVRAVPNPVVLTGVNTSVDNPPTGPQDLWVNGHKVIVNFDSADVVATRCKNVAEAINKNLEGITAVSTDTGVTITAADGRNVSAWFDSTVQGLSAASFGLDMGGAKAQVSTVEVTAGAAAAGSVSIQLNGQTITAALLAADSTPALVNTKLKSAIETAINTPSLGLSNLGVDIVGGKVTITSKIAGSSFDLRGVNTNATGVAITLATSTKNDPGSNIVTGVNLTDNYKQNVLGGTQTYPDVKTAYGTLKLIAAAPNLPGLPDADGLTHSLMNLNGQPIRIETGTDGFNAQSNFKDLGFYEGIFGGRASVDMDPPRVGRLAFQVGSSANQIITIDLADFGKNGPITSGITGDVDQKLENRTVRINTRDGATQVLNLLDVSMDKINATRSTMGAVMNRLDHVINNLTNVSMNMSASRSQIEDADYASASTELAKTQIMQQAATAVLAQANTSQQSVMKLLGG